MVKKKNLESDLDSLIGLKVEAREKLKIMLYYYSGVTKGMVEVTKQ